MPPFALVAKTARGVLEIAAANGTAAAGGVRPGMALKDARALLPALATRPADAQADAEFLLSLADWCRRYTPWTNVEGTAGLWLDVTGAAHLLGGEDGLMRDLAARLARLGLVARLGLAGTPGAAWALARFAPSSALGDRVVPAGAEAEALAPLPVEALRLEEETVRLLRRFGLKTVAQLLALPRASLKRRFPSEAVGEAVLRRLDQAVGRLDEPLSPLAPPPDHVARAAFPEPILETEGFRMVLTDLLIRLGALLEKAGQGATRLTFSAFRADGGVSRISVATARPSRHVPHLADLFAEKLERIDPGFGVDVMVLGADTVEPLGAAQMALSGDAAGDRAALPALVDRLTNRLGPRAVHRLAAVESHVPERAERAVSALAQPASQLEASVALPVRPVRLFDPPEAIEVVAQIPDGPPQLFRWRRVLRRVTRARGPERILPEWWRDLATRTRGRDYYEVEDEAGRRYWLFREGFYEADGGRLPSWRIHGLFA